MKDAITLRNVDVRNINMHAGRVESKIHLDKILFMNHQSEV
jgi:hypothetical protein